MDEVVAEARRLKILLATLETDGTAGIERAVGGIEFDPIGTQLGVSEPNRNIAFGDCRLGLAVGVLAVGLNVEARRCWSNSRRTPVSRSG